MKAERSVFLALCILLILTVTVVQSQPATCPSFARYIANGISLYIDSEYAEVVALFSPVGIDWQTFRSKCFDPDPDYWYNGLIKRVVDMFALTNVRVLQKGISDPMGVVYVVVGFYFSWSKYYSEENGVLKFRDVFKPYGGFFDSVDVESDKDVFGWEPTPSSYSAREAHWRNPNYDSAPEWYYIYLRATPPSPPSPPPPPLPPPSPPITVAIEGLPSSYSIPVYINGNLAGYVQGGGSRTFEVSEMSVTVSIGQSEIKTSDTIYRAKTDTLTVNAGEKAIFSYSREFYVSVTADPPEAANGVHGSGWYPEGSTAKISADSLIEISGYERLEFAGWSTGEKSPEISITVNSPLTLKANYNWLYRVDVRSDLAPAYGSGWYHRGDVAQVGLNGLKDGYYYTERDYTGGVRYKFRGWSVEEGRISVPDSPDFSFTVEGPVILRAEFGPPERYMEWYLLVIPVLVALPPLALWMRRRTKKAGTRVVEPRAEEKEGTRVKEPETEVKEPDLEKELSLLNERLSKLEDLYRRGEIDEEAYRKLKEEYESRKREIEGRKQE